MRSQEKNVRACMGGLGGLPVDPDLKPDVGGPHAGLCTGCTQSVPSQQGAGGECPQCTIPTKP